MRILLGNETHNTKILISPKFIGIENDLLRFRLSKHQVRKITQELCGRKKCSCELISNSKKLLYRGTNYLFTKGKWYKFHSLTEVEKDLWTLYYKEYDNAH